MTDTLRDKLVALIDAPSKVWKTPNMAIEDCITLLDEHCAGQRERFEEWNTSFPDGGYIQSLEAVAREAWQAAIATIKGDI